MTGNVTPLGDHLAATSGKAIAMRGHLIAPAVDPTPMRWQTTCRTRQLTAMSEHDDADARAGRTDCR